MSSSNIIALSVKVVEHVAKYLMEHCAKVEPLCQKRLGHRHARYVMPKRLQTANSQHVGSVRVAAQPRESEDQIVWNVQKKAEWHFIMGWFGSLDQDWSVQRVASKPDMTVIRVVCSRSCTKDSDCGSGEGCFDRGDGYTMANWFGCRKSTKLKPNYRKQVLYTIQRAENTCIQSTEGSVSGLGNAKGMC